MTPGRAHLEAEIERLRTLCASYGVHADSERERADRLEGSREHHILVSESRLKRAEKAEAEIERLRELARALKEKWVWACAEEEDVVSGDPGQGATLYEVSPFIDALAAALPKVKPRS